MRKFAATLVGLGLVLGLASSARAGQIASGSLAVNSTNPTFLTATFHHLPGYAHAEVSVTCPGFFDDQGAPDGGDKDSPWVTVFTTPFGQTGRVDLASLNFTS